jgi:hypothetical protein
MTTEEEWLLNKMKCFNNEHVKNMYWLLFSPSPLAEVSFGDFPLFPDNWRGILKENAEDFFVKLDHAPLQLETFLKESNTYRMGIYAEKLMFYFLEHYNDTKLLLSNYQFIKDNHTVGEIDFIFEWKEHIIHIEMAVKFYLCFNESNKLNDWIGPSGNDNLLKKLSKVKEHQLPLASKPLFQKETRINSESYLFLKGMFFSQNNFMPNWMNSSLTFRNYVTYSDFMTKMKSDDYLLLKRPNWMSALYVENQLAESLPKSENEINELLDKFNALHLWSKIDNNTLMVVKDKWPF